MASSTTWRGKPAEAPNGQSGSSQQNTTRDGLVFLRYPFTRQLEPAFTAPIAAPHQGQASTMNGFSRLPLYSSFRALVASSCLLGVTPCPTQSPMEIGVEPSSVGRDRRKYSQAQISDAAL